MAGYNGDRREALYRWPRVEVQTRSPLINWHNLDVGLGFGCWPWMREGYWPDFEAFERVLQGHKPMAMGLSFSPDRRPQLEEMLEHAGADRFSVSFELGELSIRPGQTLLWVDIARAATYGELFDLAMIAADYGAAGFGEVGSAMLELRELPIFDRGDSLLNRDAVDSACGLALGYPIETNLSRLAHDLYEDDDTE